MSKLKLVNNNGGEGGDGRKENVRIEVQGGNQRAIDVREVVVQQEAIINKKVFENFGHWMFAGRRPPELKRGKISRIRLVIL